MAKHARNKSRGSLSIFSLDAIRSLSRAGSRQVCPTPNEDSQQQSWNRGRGEVVTSAGMEQALLRPLPPTPGQSIRQRSNSSHVSLAEPDELVRPRRRANSDAQIHDSANVAEKDVQKRRRHRPLSWFPPSSTTSDKVSHLPKDRTALTAERSVISAPVLNSTTNARVALAEGVHCGEMTRSGLATSSWNPKSGWVSDGRSGDFAQDRFHDAGKVHDPSCSKSQPRRCSKYPGELPKRPSKRSASMHALFKVQDALRTGLRQAGNPQTYRSVFSRDKFSRLEDDRQLTSPDKDGLACTKVEGRSMGRHKVRMLTGHRRNKKQVVEYAEQENRHVSGEENSTFLVDANEESDDDGHRRHQREHALNFSFEDLESSFAKAVENLDFRIRRDKTSLTSLSSPFHSGQNISSSSQKRPPSPQKLPAVLCPQPPASANYTFHNPSPHPASDQLESAQPNMGPCLSHVSKYTSGRNKADPGVYPFPYQRDATSNGEIDKRDRDALAQRAFRRGHPNPLASHPNVLAFAERPPPTTDQPEMPSLSVTSQAKTIHKKADLEGLAGTPIYTPSLENPSQYDRNTPSSAPGSTELSSRSVSSRVPLMDTPTRPARCNAGRHHIAARNGRTLPPPSTNEAPRTPNKEHETDSPRSNLMRPDDDDDVYGGDNHAGRVLQFRDGNRRLGVDGADAITPFSFVDVTPDQSNNFF